MKQKKESKDTDKDSHIKSKNGDIHHKKADQYNLFQILIDNIPDYIYIKDRKNRFIMVNSAMADFYGKRPEDFIGKTDFDFALQKIAKESFKDDNKVIKSNKPIIDKSEKVIRSGKEFWVSSSKIPWHDRNGNIMGTMGISRDITKRTQWADNLLNKERNIINAMMNSITDNIYFKDLQSRFIRINKALSENFGIKDPEEAIGKTDFDFFSEEHAKQAYNDEQRIIATGEPAVDIEEKETFRDKKDRWVSTTKMPFYNEKGELIGTFGISRDITERKLIEHKLEKEKSLINSLMEKIPESIYFKDLQSRFIRINKALSENFGIKDPEEAIGKTDFNFFSEEHAKQAYNDEQRIIATGEPAVDIEEKETFRDKKDKWISTTKMPFYNEKGELIGTFGISRDITEKKKADEKIKYLSFHDGLTGLYNRAYFEEELRRLDTERQLPITVVMGDLNGLKLINDAYGHAKGDVLLKSIADILKESFRKEDIISRWGGDEFISILPRTNAEDAKNIVNRIKDLCKERSTTEVPLSISFGISTKKSSSENINDILKIAEEKMYKNKVAENRSVHENLVESLKENLKKGDYRGETRIKKMEEYALLIGKKLKLSNVKLEELSLLLNLHDIGKLALVDEIMAKKGRLSKEEWKIIKELPIIGYRIAESSPKLKTIAESILSHHEWYNGQGYPRGIKGDEIPILSRISFLVNSYEAMTRDRPYRKRMTIREAIEEIKRCCGTQFDPKIVKIFLEIIKEKE
jgi:diguanylate cyclase (GGDEF)-like protein/PAS domain S-box-containing protein